MWLWAVDTSRFAGNITVTEMLHTVCVAVVTAAECAYPSITGSFHRSQLICFCGGQPLTK